LHRRRDDPDHATQSHAEHMRALAEATRKATAAAGVDGTSVLAIAIDTTGSSVVPVDAQLRPLDDYYLWCDHRAWREAAEITEAAHSAKLPSVSGKPALTPTVRVWLSAGMRHASITVQNTTQDRMSMRAI
jgi:L-ribulokinase